MFIIGGGMSFAIEESGRERVTFYVNLKLLQEIKVYYKKNLTMNKCFESSLLMFGPMANQSSFLSIHYCVRIFMRVQVISVGKFRT